MKWKTVGLILVPTGLALASATSAQVRPAPNPKPLPPLEIAVRCIPGFTLADDGSTYVCTSAPIQCDRRYHIRAGAEVVGDRFVYRCSKPPR